jgi:hypothetical protein
MLTEISKIDNVVEEAPIKKKIGRPRKQTPPPKPPKVRVYVDNPRQYYLDYYNSKIKKTCICDICNKEIKTTNGLKYHQKNNKDCQIIKLNNIINESINK